MPADSLHPDLNDRDLEPVRELILGLLDDVRRGEREKQLLMAAATWTNAFTSFKRLRKKIGLPQGRVQCLGYGAIVSSLKSTGKMLLGHMLRQEFNPEDVGLSMENFEACVAELVDDDLILDSGLLQSDLSHVEKIFATA